MKILHAREVKGKLESFKKSEKLKKVKSIFDLDSFLKT